MSSISLCISGSAAVNSSLLQRWLDAGEQIPTDDDIVRLWLDKCCDITARAPMHPDLGSKFHILWEKHKIKLQMNGMAASWCPSRQNKMSAVKCKSSITFLIQTIICDGFCLHLNISVKCVKLLVFHFVFTLIYLNSHCSGSSVSTAAHFHWNFLFSLHVLCFKSVGMFWPHFSVWSFVHVILKLKHLKTRSVYSFKMLSSINVNIM